MRNVVLTRDEIREYPVNLVQQYCLNSETQEDYLLSSDYKVLHFGGTRLEVYIHFLYRTSIGRLVYQMSCLTELVTIFTPDCSPLHGCSRFRYMLNLSNRMKALRCLGGPATTNPGLGRESLWVFL